MTSNYVIVHTLQKMTAGQNISHWPLHITLVPWFSAGCTEAQLTNLLRKTASNHKNMALLVLNEVVFNEKKNLVVNLIDTSPELDKLHIDLIKDLRHVVSARINSNYIQDGYTPHITHQGKQSMNPSDEVVLDSFNLVRANSNYQDKQVVERFLLS